MLLRLHIRDLAIIDELTLDFSRGFTALTGETGAGKSIIVGALNLVLGERASSDDVRSGSELASVEALFEIEGRGILKELLAEWNLLVPSAEGATAKRGRKKSESLELVIRREITAAGRGRCLVNGRLIPLSQLKRIGDCLADLHGQHQHQSLLRAELHRVILDAFGGAGLGKALEAYRDLYKRYTEVAARLRALNRDERDVERRKGVLEYQIGEIRDAAPEPGEDEALEKERRRLEHADTLQRNAGGANDLLYEGESNHPTADDLLAQSEALVAEAAGLDPSLEALGERLAAAREELGDVAATLRSYAAGLERDPARMAEVEDRLHLIRRLKRKYGAAIGEILAACEGFEGELNGLTHSREERERLEAERASLERELGEAAEELSLKRRSAGESFSKGIRSQLKDLEMPNVRFQVRLGREEKDASEKTAEDANARDKEDFPIESGGDMDDEKSRGDARGTWVLFPDGKRYRVHEYGVDQTEFLLSPNRGEDLKALRRIASGGELSRIMLALKVLMRKLDQLPTLVFDEIDTGISGRTGTRIGEKMRDLGGKYQVICITHLPQIAARADAHFSVRKVREKGRTLTRVERLAPEDRLGEIARLLGGETDSAIARRHAEELLAACDA